ncbi:MAG: hypothetical protein ACYS22_14375 [Planctomycetota bacterium]|jgi:hypothetical protein
MTDTRISVVIPTMKRLDTGYLYLNRTLARHGQLLASGLFSTRFLYLSDADLTELSPVIMRYQLTPITRKRHPELAGLDEGNYQWWRHHLCLDFAHSMSCALEESAARYFMWLEDDTWLGPWFARAWSAFLRRHPDFSAVSAFHEARYGGSGACCVVLEREALQEFNDMVRHRCAENIPLDWLLARYPRHVFGLGVKSAFHIGERSSQPSATLRARDLDHPFPSITSAALRRITRDAARRLAVAAVVRILSRWRRPLTGSASDLRSRPSAPAGRWT